MKKYRDLINRPHPACKIVSVSIPAIRLDKKNANTIPKRYAGKFKKNEKKSFLLNEYKKQDL